MTLLENLIVTTTEFKGRLSILGSGFFFGTTNLAYENIGTGSLSLVMTVGTHALACGVYFFYSPPPSGEEIQNPYKQG